MFLHDREGKRCIVLEASWDGLNQDKATLWAKGCVHLTCKDNYDWLKELVYLIHEILQQANEKVIPVYSHTSVALGWVLEHIRDHNEQTLKRCLVVLHLLRSENIFSFLNVVLHGENNRLKDVVLPISVQVVIKESYKTWEETPHVETDWIRVASKKGDGWNNVLMSISENYVQRGWEHVVKVLLDFGKNLLLVPNLLLRANALDDSVDGVNTSKSSLNLLWVHSFFVWEIYGFHHFHICVSKFLAQIYSKGNDVFIILANQFL